MVQVQFVDPTHERQIARRRRSRHVIHRSAREPQKLCLTSDRKSVLGIDHRFALASSIRPSAMDKKSFSMASCPIFACRSLTLGPWAFCFSAALANTWATCSRSCAFHCVICCGCTSKRSASWASVWSPLIAAKATLALKSGECLRRGRFIASAPIGLCPIRAELLLSGCLKKRSPLYVTSDYGSLKPLIDTPNLFSVVDLSANR